MSLSVAGIQRWTLALGVGVLLALSTSVQAQRVKEGRDSLDALAFGKPELRVAPQVESSDLLRSTASGDKALAAVFEGFDRFLTREGGAWSLQVDRLTGRPALVEGAGVPWIPGAGNALKPSDFGLRADQTVGDLPAAVVAGRAEAFQRDYPELFGVDPSELRLVEASSGPLLGYLYFLHYRWVPGGVPVENAYVVFRVNHGNLVQFGSEGICPEALRGLPLRPSLTEETAWQIAAGFVGGLGRGDRPVGKPRLTVLPVSRGDAVSGLPVRSGEGLAYRLVYTLQFRRQGVLGTWEAKVDAHTGEVLSFLDANRYGTVQGGVYKTDQPATEASVSFPFADWKSGFFADAAGGFPGAAGTSAMAGKYVTVDDVCGDISLASDAAGVLDFGASPDTNCSTPGFGGAGNTRASRTQYWNVTQIKMKAMTYLPANTWLPGNLADRVNIHDSCNAYWDGAGVNFFWAAAGCGNTGEIPGVSLHEWGHGMDSNDGSPSGDAGTGETYGDFTGALQTHQSCMGGGFLSGDCSGYGDACSDCTGVRELDYAQHASGKPHFPQDLTSNSCSGCTAFTCAASTSYKGPCGREGHCESAISSEALWDLAARDLPAAGMDADSAWQLVDKFWYASRPTSGKAYECPTVTGSNGCGTANYFTTFRVVDDCDGNLANGTPHAAAIYAAFNRHKIACTTVVNTNNNCGCSTPAAPVLSGTPGHRAITLTWPAVAGASSYEIYRNESTCGAGYTRVATLADTSFTDTPLVNGVSYNYRAQALGAGACPPGPMSACLTSAPVAQPDALYITGSASSTSPGGDGDAFADNCETATATFQVFNDGSVALTNVRATVTTSSPSVAIVTSMPVNLGPLAVAGTATGSFDYRLSGAVCGESPAFTVSVTSDQQAPGSNQESFGLGATEQDYLASSSRTDSFETGMDGWTGTFTRDANEASLGAWSLHSSSELDLQCDVARSTPFVATASSSVTMAVRYDIEATSSGTPWDKANVHAVDVVTGAHTLLTPTGRTYTTTGASGASLCHITDEAAWNGTVTAYADAVFDLSPFAGQALVLEVNYNTDPATAQMGLYLDNIRWANVRFQGCDLQSDSCLFAPGEVGPGREGESSGLHWTSATSLAWPDASGATAYTLYRGVQADLLNGDILNGNPDSCTRPTAGTTATGLTETPPEQGFYWYLVTGTNGALEGPAGDGSMGAKDPDSDGPC